jgi:hypothetical protein
MNAYPGREHLLIRDAIQALGCDRDLMTTTGKGVREIKHMPLLTADVRREELR